MQGIQSAKIRDFRGNAHAVRSLEGMLATGRIPQSLLFAGPEGVGKATLARRFAAALLIDAGFTEAAIEKNGAGIEKSAAAIERNAAAVARIEQDDLSLPENVERVGAREKLAADKRNDDPLVFASHPDFLTFAPDGPLRQISIPQMRLLKDRAQFLPSRGSRRVFLIDHIDRAGEQAANSLLKTLEEPPAHLVIILTAENAYDLLPTIRSRTVPLTLFPLNDDEMRAFAKEKCLTDAERRIRLASGSPGLALTLDLPVFEKRRAAMLALLRAASGTSQFQSWLPASEAMSRSKNEKLELYLGLLYDLIRDVMLLREGRSDLRHADLRAELLPIANKVSARWLQVATRKTDDLVGLVRRNIQKTIALDALIMDLRRT